MALAAEEVKPAEKPSSDAPTPAADVASASSPSSAETEKKKASQPAAESRYAVIEAVPGHEDDDDDNDEDEEEADGAEDAEARYAHDRDAEDEEEEDQIALESHHIDKDGHSAPVAYAQAPQVQSKSLDLYLTHSVTTIEK